MSELGGLAHETEKHRRPILMTSSTSTTTPTRAAVLPRGCTFTDTDWQALAPFWYPVAFSHEIVHTPYAATLLDERLAVYRLSDRSLVAARDICHHRGVPLSLGHVERDDPGYLQVVPKSVAMEASAGRQVEGFLDVSHFAFIHAKSFGEPDNPVVPDYRVTKTSTGFVADYISTVSNYSHEHKHLNPPGFLWRRRFEVFLPFAAELTVFFPKNGQLQILNAASPVSARKMRLFVPICRNFDQHAPVQATLDFNHQVFSEDMAIVERQFPEDLPLDLNAEAHFPADQSSIAYRQGLAALGLGRSFTS